MQISPFSEVRVLPLSEAKLVANKVNTQLFENSSVALEPATDEYNHSLDRLHNSVDNPPNLAIIQEQPWHRMVCYLVAQGLSKTDIAKRTGKTIPWISQLTRQPWFRMRLVQELKEAGVDAVQQVIKSNALDSVYTLVELRDDESAPKAVRKSAADSLLDRYLGKPTQKIESEIRRAPSSDEIHKLDSEIKALESEINDGERSEHEVGEQNI